MLTRRKRFQIVPHALDRFRSQLSVEQISGKVVFIQLGNERERRTNIKTTRTVYTGFISVIYSVP